MTTGRITFRAHQHRSLSQREVGNFRNCGEETRIFRSSSIPVIGGFCIDAIPPLGSSGHSPEFISHPEIIDAVLT